MMSRSEFDKHFRDQLYNHAVKPPAAAWDAIEAGLDKNLPGGNTNGSRWIRLGLLGALLLAAVATILIATRHQEAETNAGAAVTAAEVAVAGSGSGGVNPELLNLADREALLSRSGVSEEESANPDRATARMTGKGSIAATDANSSNSGQKTGSQPEDAGTTGYFPKINSQAGGTNPSAVSEVQPQLLLPTASENVLPATARSPFNAMFLKSSTDPLELQPGFKSTSVIDCYSFNRNRKGSFVVDLYTGPAVALRNLNSRQEDVGNYIMARDTTENRQISWHAGLRFGYEHNSGFTVRTGLHYSLVNEVFRTETREMRYQVNYDSMFNPIDTVLITGTRVKQTQNRYHALDIPLLVGYKLVNGNWDLGIQAGPTFNLMFKARGDMLDQIGQVASFSDENALNYVDAFKTRVGVGIYASAYAAKRVGSNLYVFAEPHLLHRFGSITNDNYPIDQRQSQIGLSVGVRLKISR